MAKSKSFGNLKQDNFINHLLQHAANVGFQYSNRYIVLVHGPGMSYVTSTGGVQNGRLDITSGIGLGVEEKKRLATNCTMATLGGKKLEIEEFAAIASGPTIHFPVAEKYTSSFILQFNCSSDFFERKYFTAWNQKVINPITHMVELYENYAKPWKVMVAMLPHDIGSFDAVAPAFSNSSQEGYNLYGEGTDRQSTRAAEHQIYFTRFCECYPVEIMDETVASAPIMDVMKTSVRFHFRYIEDPVSIFMDQRIRQRDQVAFKQEPLSPFDQFRKIARDIARYSNPKELRQLLIDKGLDVLNETLGTSNVERMAKAGQIVDVYRRTPDKNYQVTQSRLIGPLGDII